MTYQATRGVAARARLLRPVAIAAAVTIGAAGLAACGPAGEDDTFVLHYTTYSSPTSDQSKAVQRWAEEVEQRTDGGVTVRFHYSESLVDADEAVRASQDGRADLAQVGSIYAASDLSMFTVIELPFETNNPEVQMTAIMRLYEENQTYREDFERQGVRFLFPIPLGNAVLGTNRPVESVDDLRGRSIRSGGLMSEVMLAVGANPVAMTANDIYESLERGVVDGYTALAVANLSTFGLAKTTRYLTDPGVGAYSSSIVVVNEEVYQSMPDRYQQALQAASDNSIANGLEEMDAAAGTACAELKAAGTEFGAFPEDQVADWKERADIAESWVARYEQKGYDARSVLEDYRRIIDEETPRSDYRAPLAACMKGEVR
ncbi:C4-dicarboxylate TRAP transporter substrate-binding protein [Actinophytocola gossypii]|uniref:C4-dicarboxylate TRAP transporter substrate-binding protein n=1 Tax=Actinophytocola gossypii TaxID=2812003 RepID=A0ABT2J2V7_9PSEU|nr:C4-dicarboxylate TRAP transporter substrate-binding protein [Actinophytocola gossypii]MCT2582138.1 C4-dicarboxylate TRAP transporter substrate-binding protein [Actinophytocola gossypii]